jgi:hypothetical protein
MNESTFENKEMAEVDARGRGMDLLTCSLAGSN